MIHDTLLPILACPTDRSALHWDGHQLWCQGEVHNYRRGELNYLELTEASSPIMQIRSTSSECAHLQEVSGERVYTDYLLPWLRESAAKRVLDAGCGMGMGVVAARLDGYLAVGLDIPAVAPFWHAEGRSPDDFVLGDVGKMPFQDNAFDVAISLGVIEHVGTRTGHLTLADDWREQREAFARELSRVVRPGGRLLIACPNKWFSIDIQHGPTDEHTTAPLRAKIFRRFGVNVHQTWGAYHLASYSDLHRWFGRRNVRPLPLRGYFGFSALERDGVPPIAGRAARAWVERLPGFLRTTPLNPYLLAEIRM